MANFDLNNHADVDDDDTEDNQSSSIGEEDEDDAMSLDSQFTHKHLERVGQYLKDAPLDQTVDRSLNHWEQFLRAHPDIYKLDCIIKVNPNTSLVQEFETVRTAVENIFHNRKIEMSDRCQFIGEVKLAFPKDSAVCRQFKVGRTGNC